MHRNKKNDVAPQPLQILDFKNEKKSMVSEITNRDGGLRSPEISFGFFVYCKFALLES